jgi:Na+-translocating ferredoxin:NAD+ oxidoreductase RnfD subunit
VSRRLTGPLLITLILLAGHLSYGVLEGYPKILLAVAVSIVVELALSRFLRGTWPNVASAYITGISIGILVRSSAWWPYALGSAISITSKYVLRYRGNHLWNPSNFGVCALFLLAPFAVAPLTIQWGNTVWPMAVIWGVGSLTIWRLGRFHVCAAYVLSFLALAVVRGGITGNPVLAEIAPITGPMYQLFIFFMITDPRTTVRSRRGRIVVAVLVAVVEAGLRLAEVVYAPFYALFLVGPTAMLLDLRYRGLGNTTGLSLPSRLTDATPKT